MGEKFTQDSKKSPNLALKTVEKSENEATAAVYVLMKLDDIYELD
jgi:hypothetical protein